ncbi:MAG: 2-amino-3,7-dideoxy-D-threo-hept-6-ulosonate synthase [Methanocella sp. PtaU1.Bin125]|nr:MAG: 2-amino-3,7-dideoxy-D-threo-hept-6-ulosonate synthase [Methanocella sp. PtaU1.Bin125]
MVPMDHGITIGPVTGLANITQSTAAAADGGADAVIMHKGIVKECYARYPRDLGLIVHLSASTNLSVDPDHKIIITRPLEAMRLGADAVSVHVNVGSEKESEMLKDLGEVSRACEGLGLPLLAMMYPRGKNIHNQYDPDLIAHACRAGAEMGADIIKTNYTGEQDTFREVVKGCPVPIIIAGGMKTSSDKELLDKIKGAIDSGASGVAVGRNVFMHETPAIMVRRIRGVVHEGLTPEEAIKQYQ